MITNTCPHHIYFPAVAEALNKNHNMSSCGYELAGKYQDEIELAWKNGISPEKCAADLHDEWLHKKIVYKESTLSDHLKSGTCLGVYDITGKPTK